MLNTTEKDFYLLTFPGDDSQKVIYVKFEDKNVKNFKFKKYFN
jgi:hypothetical protein